MAKTKIWYTADGRDIQIRQMGTDHLMNCLNLIERRPARWIGVHIVRWRWRYRRPLYAELERRGVFQPNPWTR